MKKLGFLFLALVLVMGTLGVSYSMWTNQVTLNANVNSGNVCLKWTTGNNLDPCVTLPKVSDDYSLIIPVSNATNPNAWNYNQGLPYFQTSKDIGCTSVTGFTSNSLTVTVTNAYPGYYNDLEVDFCNCGSIPLVLQNITVTTHGFTNAATAVTNMWNDPPVNGVCTPVWVSVHDGLGTQVDPQSWCTPTNGLTCCKAASVFIVVQECAAMNSCYSFTITWNAVQWNEYNSANAIMTYNSDNNTSLCNPIK